MSSSTFMTVFINLASDVGKRQAMDAQLHGLGLPFARQEAVPGGSAPSAIASYFYDKHSKPTYSLTQGEAGCFASHLLVCQRICEGEWPEPVLVLEDDAVAPSDIVDLVKDVLAKLPADWDIVRMSDNLKCAFLVDSKLEGGRFLVRHSKIPRGTGAYLVNRSGARKILRLRPRNLAFDVELVHSWNIDLSTFGVAPPPFSAAPGPSSIDSMEAGRLLNVRRFSLRRADVANLHKRLRFNIKRLGFLGWVAGVAVNASNHARKALGLKVHVPLALQW